MKTAAKWVAIVWSVVCIIGVIAGILNYSSWYTHQGVGNQDDASQAGAFLGIGLGLGVWIVLWFAIAGPAIIVYFVLGKKQTSAPAVQSGRTATSRLCIECGKYYDGEPKFCPNCGKPMPYKSPGGSA